MHEQKRVRDRGKAKIGRERESERSGIEESPKCEKDEKRERENHHLKERATQGHLHVFFFLLSSILFSSLFSVDFLSHFS